MIKTHDERKRLADDVAGVFGAIGNNDLLRLFTYKREAYKMKNYEKMKKHAWIVLATAIVVFIAIVFTVYYVAVPRNLSKIAYNEEDYDEAW